MKKVMITGVNGYIGTNLRNWLEKQGYQVTALEPSKNLCREIRKGFSGEIVCSDIQSYQPTERYDGIWACASLIHLQEEEVLCFFRKIDMYLNPADIMQY